MFLTTTMLKITKAIMELIQHLEFLKYAEGDLGKVMICKKNPVTH